MTWALDHLTSDKQRLATSIRVRIQ